MNPKSERIPGVPWLVLVWLQTATAGLGSNARAQISEEMEQHYADSVRNALEKGKSGEEAALVALAQLGSAEAANRQFKKTHFTEAEETIVRNLQNPTSRRWRFFLAVPVIQVIILLNLGATNGQFRSFPSFYFFAVICPLALVLALIVFGLYRPASLKRKILVEGARTLFVQSLFLPLLAVLPLELFATWTIGLITGYWYLFLGLLPLWRLSRIYRKIEVESAVESLRTL